MSPRAARWQELQGRGETCSFIHLFLHSFNNDFLLDVNFVPGPWTLTEPSPGLDCGETQETHPLIVPIWRDQDRDKSETLTGAFCFPLQLLLSPERESPSVSGENELVFGVQVTCQVWPAPPRLSSGPVN